MVAFTSPQALLVFTTLPDPDAARALVRRLVDERIVACGTLLGDATSIYRWQGRIEESREVQVVLKTQPDRWPALEAAVREGHPYEVPELIAVPVVRGLEPYLRWIADETLVGGSVS